jgi:hypothetical protein
MDLIHPFVYPSNHASIRSTTMTIWFSCMGNGFAILAMISAIDDWSDTF